MSCKNAEDINGFDWKLGFCSKWKNGPLRCYTEAWLDEGMKRET